MNHNKTIRIFEHTSHPLRSGRFYAIEDKWYFMARENQDQGPFVSKEDAIKGLELFLAKIKGDEPDSWEINNEYLTY